MPALPVATPAYLGPFTWNDHGWRCCRVCDVEWDGDGHCFHDPSHPGTPGRLRSYCRHGLRRVAGAGAVVCPRCEYHRASDLTPEFLDALALSADRVVSAVRRSP